MSTETNNVFNERDILFTNLALLGLYECRDIPIAYHGVELSRTMFAGASPNLKGLEVVLWFLFSRLDEQKARSVSKYWINQLASS
jgi:hypothetical protein